MKRAIVIACFWLAAGLSAAGAETELFERTFEAKDSVEALRDDEGLAGQALRTLGWAGEAFEVTVRDTPGRDYDARITFTSPKPSGDAELDEVVLRWYRPEAARHPRTAYNPQPLPNPPAASVLLVHTLHPDLPVATMLARGLRERGVHGFVIELPGYASRVGAERKMTGVTTLVNAAQAVSDCRRAYDVIQALGREDVADLDEDRIAIQGTSLGSFIATSAAALDGCFDQTFLFLSGGDGVNILETGQKDAFHVRGALKHYGYTGDKLRALIDPVEPLHIAHRLDPETTWMFNARHDTVIPAKNADLLAEAIGLGEDHLVWMNGNHYTAFILLPGVLDRMKTEMGVQPAAPTADDAEQAMKE
ncbi:MAG: hypothetical protein AAF911_12000 [Planctomycetota bacterium]